MSKNPGVCWFEDCRRVGQARSLSLLDMATSPAGRAMPHGRDVIFEICGAHWPEVRAKTADQGHWRAVTADGSISFEIVGVPA